MQNAILAELENSYQESRKDKENGRFTASRNDLCPYLHAEFASGSTEDLLVPNPNHAPIVPDDAESGDGGDEDEMS